MQSPFLATEVEAEEALQEVSLCVCPAPTPAPSGEDQEMAGLLEDIDQLCVEIRKAKVEIDALTKGYDAMRAVLLTKLDKIGKESIETGEYKAAVKTRKSGWTYSDETSLLQAKVKKQMEVEERMGIATPKKESRWAEVSAPKKSNQ